MNQIGSGVLKRHRNKTLLVDPTGFTGNRINGTSILLPNQLMQKYQLVEGATVTGPAREGDGVTILEEVENVCGLSPVDFRKRKPYTQLTAVAPFERFNLSVTGDPAMRIVDVIAPIAKGTRGLIVSPPRAGKTILLEQIAKAIHAFDPEIRIIVLLIDERPEEVTHFRRAVNAEVIASSNDYSFHEHVELTRFVMKHMITELECGKDVVVLVDSLTRMARAFNSKGSPKQKGRIMTGGLQAGIMEVPRRFFGLARSIEGGGSVTIIATILVDTGSRMDQLIFEEFKGTGNSEIILDRSLAEARVFPAINLLASGTRKEERLYEPHQIQQINRLRRALTKIKSNKEAMELLLKFLNKYPTNEDFLNEPAAQGA
ncbi:MAG: transcription termination factor Rho [Candidatus Aminicenantes bacterium]|nr:MAG: transcription termination factor Rho [Candidatus Aminicenantes bacterium]